MIKVFLLIILVFQSIIADSIFEFTESNTEFKALAIGYPRTLKIEVKNKSLSGRATQINNKIQGEFILNTNEFETGISLRDKHLKDKYLDSEKYPKTILKIKDLNLSNEEFLGVERKEFKGNLLFHGVEKEVRGIMTLAKNEDKIFIFASFKIDLVEFAMDIPSYLGITVAKEVEVEIKTSANIK